MRSIAQTYTPKFGLGLMLAVATIAHSGLADRAQAADDSGKSFFWKVTAPDGAYVYLLGSIHVANKGMYPLPKAVEDAFAESANLVVEANVDDPTIQVKVQQDMMAKGTYAAGDSLDKHMSEKSMKTFNDYATTSGLPQTNWPRCGRGCWQCF